VLESLHIRNLALVVELDIEFGAGLNAVTGETGAGKSLILGAVQLLLGGRAGAGVIRTGESQCEISAILHLGEDYGELRRAVAAQLDAGGVAPCEENRLLIRRVVTPSGSRVFVNGSPATVGFLGELGALLVDIHGPHEHQSLLRPQCQLALLDAFAGLDEQTEVCADAYRAWQEAQKILIAERERGINPGEVDLLRHQLREIDNAELRPDEEEELVEMHHVASHAQRLAEIAAQCSEGLSEAEGCVTDQLSLFVRLVNELESLDAERGAVFSEQLSGIVESIHELSVDLTNYGESRDLDPEQLQMLEERLNLIQKLKRRYGGTIEDVLQAADEIREQLDAFDSRAERLAELEREVGLAKRAHRAICAELSIGRREASAKLAEAISDKLRRLGFLQARFAVDVTESEPGPTGADRAEFGFAPNPGEAMQPLRRIASSGEMARVMLAVKTVLSAADHIPVLIFDEVDANIGGRVAVTVAEELAAIGHRHQVLSITHLPQIAAAGHRHFQVAKRIDGERTITTMLSLEGEDREREIMRMLGADSDSTTARNHARELLASLGGERKAEEAV
jgi:DNA repair protein RecN (Recombination protein N)